MSAAGFVVAVAGLYLAVFVLVELGARLAGAGPFVALELALAGIVLVGGVIIVQNLRLARRR